MKTKIPTPKTMFYLTLILVLSITPLVIRIPYVTIILYFSLIYIILALSYNLVLGYTGLFSLAHAAFFAVGAYTSALLSVNLRMQFLPSIFAAGLSAMIVAYAIILVALRTSYHSFGLVTLALSLILTLIYKNWVEITKGPMGIPGIPRPYIEFLSFNIEFSTDIQCYYLALVITVLSLLFLRRVTSSRVGRALIALRENLILAESIGINSKKYMIFAFVLGAFFAGVSGSLYAHFVRYVNPEVFSTSLTVMSLTIAIIGGIGGFDGVLIAALLLYIIPEILRFAPEWREVLFGVILLACIYFFPDGVEGIFKSLFKRKPKGDLNA